MKKNLLMLEELQELDLKIDGWQNEKAVLLAEIAALELKVDEARSAIALLAEERTTLETEKAAIEESLATEADNIVKSESRLKEIKTQKEYQAVLKEVATAKKLNTELEEQLLQKIARLEELTSEITSKEQDLGELESNISCQKQEVQTKVDKLEQEISVDLTTKESTAKSLPSSILKRYSMLREKRQGVAVVEARDGYCLGCNMHLPPQLYNTLFRSDDLILCPHCQRMLVLRQQAQNG